MRFEAGRGERGEVNEVIGKEVGTGLCGSSDDSAANSARGEWGVIGVGIECGMTSILGDGGRTLSVIGWGE